MFFFHLRKWGMIFFTYENGGMIKSGGPCFSCVPKGPGVVVVVVVNGVIHIASDNFPS